MWSRGGRRLGVVTRCAGGSRDRAGPSRRRAGTEGLAPGGPYSGGPDHLSCGGARVFARIGPTWKQRWVSEVDGDSVMLKHANKRFHSDFFDQDLRFEDLRVPLDEREVQRGPGVDRDRSRQSDRPRVVADSPVLRVLGDFICDLFFG